MVCASRRLGGSSACVVGLTLIVAGTLSAVLGIAAGQRDLNDF